MKNLSIANNCQSCAQLSARSSTLRVAEMENYEMLLCGRQYKPLKMLASPEVG